VTVQDRIEKEIVIEAPPEVVWRVVTQPAHIECWFSDSAEFDLRPGAEGTLGGQGDNIADHRPLENRGG